MRLQNLDPSSMSVMDPLHFRVATQRFSPKGSNPMHILQPQEPHGASSLP